MDFYQLIFKVFDNIPNSLDVFRLRLLSRGYWLSLYLGRYSWLSRVNLKLPDPPYPQLLKKFCRIHYSALASHCDIPIASHNHTKTLSKGAEPSRQGYPIVHHDSQRCVSRAFNFD